MVSRRLSCRALRRAVDGIWVKLGGRHHLIGPSTLGHGPPDCRPTSLQRVVPWESDESIACHLLDGTSSVADRLGGL